jgi:hypothetical protein
MQPNTLKLFAQFCESYLPEASSSMELIQQHPGGSQVIKKLHTDQKLGHDISYQPVPKISWSELKDSYRGAWVIIQGDKGTGAIKASGGNTGDYFAVASSGGETRSMNDSRGGNVLDFLKGEIGGLRKFYVGKNTTAVTDKQNKRASNKDGAGTNVVSQETLIKKFKPLWAKAITAAIADIKGHVANQIKNDAFEKAKRKLEHIEQLQQGLEAIESGNKEVPQFVGTAVNTAILMAASHHYPEQTGKITKSYSRSYNSENSEGPKLLLKDISEGDTAKLGTILAFFKRSLISG